MHYPAVITGKDKPVRADLVCSGIMYGSQACKQMGRERVSTSYFHRSYLGPLTTFNSYQLKKEDKLQDLTIIWLLFIRTI